MHGAKREGFCRFQIQLLDGLLTDTRARMAATRVHLLACTEVINRFATLQMFKQHGASVQISSGWWLVGRPPCGILRKVETDAIHANSHLNDVTLRGGTLSENENQAKSPC